MVQLAGGPAGCLHISFCTTAAFLLAVCRTVDQRSRLEFMSVIIFLSGKVPDKVYMFSVTYIVSSGGSAAEFVVMFI